MGKQNKTARAVVLAVPFVWLVFVATTAWAVAPMTKDNRTGPERLLDYCVTVNFETTCGSGVLFVNKEKVFVWTNAHVVGRAVNITVQEETGEGMISLRKVNIFRYPFAESEQYLEQKAKIIRYHPKIDLALLLLDDKAFAEKSVKFCQKSPQVGERLWHAGGPLGDLPAIFAHRISRTGRVVAGQLYDQTAGAFFPGCSGGGVFRVNKQNKENTVCCGLLTQYAYPGSHGLGLHIPTRVMWAFAKKYDCLWAMDPKKEVPEVDYRCPYCLAED